MLLLLLPLLVPQEGDLFAASIAPLGDVDGDEVPDFVVSDPWEDGEQEDGEQEHCGWIGLVSGDDRSLVWELRGKEKDGELGTRLQSVGDVDGDGAQDFAHAPRWVSRFLHVHSGRTGAFLLSLGGRHVGPAGDVDGDGRDDLLVTPYECPEENDSYVVGRVHSGANGRALVELRAPEPASFPRPETVGDLDGDGRADWAIHVGGRLALYSAPGGERLEPEGSWRVAHVRPGLWASTAEDGSVTLHVGDAERRLRACSDIVLPRVRLAEIGDADGDGRPDVLVAVHGVDPWRGMESRVHSGATGDPLWTVPDDPSRIDDLLTLAAGDLDGDGVQDVLAGYHWCVGGPEVPGRIEARSGEDGRLLFTLRRADLR